MYVSGSVTAESATDPTLADALKTMTVARYGRDGKGADMDDAVSTAIRDHEAAAVGAFADLGVVGQLRALAGRHAEEGLGLESQGARVRTVPRGA